MHRPATADERAFLNRYGKVSATTSMRAMAYALRGGKQAERDLVELKVGGRSLALVRRPHFHSRRKVADAIHCEDDGICGAAAEQTLLDRLHVKRGDLIKVGNATLRIIAVLDKEPDRISTGFSLGPHLLVSAKALANTGLIQPGSLIDYSYRVAFKPGIQPFAGFKAERYCRVSRCGLEDP